MNVLTWILNCFNIQLVSALVASFFFKKKYYWCTCLLNNSLGLQLLTPQSFLSKKISAYSRHHVAFILHVSCYPLLGKQKLSPSPWLKVFNLHFQFCCLKYFTLGLLSEILYLIHIYILALPPSFLLTDLALIIFQQFSLFFGIVRKNLIFYTFNNNLIPSIV